MALAPYAGRKVCAKSLANLQRGYVPTDPVIRSQRARKAGLARAKRSMTDLERRVLNDYGMAGLQGFRLGLKVGKNQAYQQARKAASAMIAKIPLVLSRHIAASWKPEHSEARTA